MLRLPCLFLAACLACAKIARPSVPPMGFNTFDSYGDGKLNETGVLALADAMAAQLLPHGYDTLTLDGGWSTTTLPNGTKKQNLDRWGRAVPDRARFPRGMAWLAAQLRQRGLKLGLWTIRGVHADAVAARLPVFGMEHHTLDELVDALPVGGGANGSCLWASEWLGVNMSHPAAQTYYDGRVALLTGQDDAAAGGQGQGADFIKADCMMCAPCYDEEIVAFSRAVEALDWEVALSYSPGGGNQPKDGDWVARNGLATMYRVLTDFHGGWYGWGGLRQALFIAGNFSSAQGAFGDLSTVRANGTFPDLDMLPLSAGWWDGSDERNPDKADRGATIATLWMMARSPLMHAGPLPSDPTTLGYLTNAGALAVRASAAPRRIVGYDGNCTAKDSVRGVQVGAPCVQKWATAVVAPPPRPRRPHQRDSRRARQHGRGADRRDCHGGGARPGRWSVLRGGRHLGADVERHDGRSGARAVHGDTAAACFRVRSADRRTTPRLRVRTREAVRSPGFAHATASFGGAADAPKARPNPTY
jgi:hypothetical protein